MSDQSVPFAASRDRSVLYEALKRLLDILAASVLLLLLGPLMLAVALVIRRTSPGPVLFRQIRVGRGNRMFHIYKFRTMYVNADRHGPQITSSDDCRVTTIGRILRSLKLDEFPQLLNVLRGDMSLVGPRPQVPRFVEEFEPQHREIVLAVRPGITGPTQLQFRNEESLLEGRSNREQYYIEELLPVKCRMDVEYVCNRSLLYDLQVLFRTGGLFMRSTCRRIGRTVVCEAVVEQRAEEPRNDQADVLT